MKQKRLSSALKNMVIFLLLSCTNAGFAADEKYHSPLSIIAANNGKTLYVAQATGRRVSFINTFDGAIIKTVNLSDQLSGMAISPDGKTLYVTGGDFDGKVFVIDTNTARLTDTIIAGHCPTAPAVSIDGKTLYICRQFEDKVIAIDIAGRKITAEIPVTREPVAAVLTPDGKKLFVANSLPAGRVDGDFTAAVVSVIDTAKNKTVETVTLSNGSINLKGIAASPNGEYIYVTHVLARYQMPTTQLERGWMNTNAMTIIKAGDNKVLTTVLLDEIDLGAANPWGIACTNDGKFICIAHAGTHEISVIDRIAMHEKIEKISRGEKVSDVSSSLEDIQNDLSFMVGLRRRIKLKGNGPRNLALIGTKAYICQYFTDTIAVADIDPQVRPDAVSFSLGPDAEMTIARKGEMLFNDASICFQQWQSCASCHPNNARPDAINWDLLNDGIGNPKNTKSLLLSHKTPPSMIGGGRKNAEAGVRAGIESILFAVRPQADAVAIDEYLKSLKPLPSPYLVKSWLTGSPKLSKTAKNGKKIFNKAHCSSCHSGGMFTNMASYDIGTGNPSQQPTVFDTPTLIEIWRTAPYLQDGRAATMKEVLTDFNIDDKHGKTSNLTDKQIDELVEYILSL